MTALALSYSTADYAAPVWARSPHANYLDPGLAPVWARSPHANYLDPGLNQAFRSVTGCLRPTNVEDLYLLSGIAPPVIRRDGKSGKTETINQRDSLSVWSDSSYQTPEV